MTVAGTIGLSETVIVLLVALPVLAVQVGLLWLGFVIVRDSIRWVRRALGAPRGERPV